MEEQQLDDRGDPYPSSVREGQGSDTTEDRSRPEVNVATWGTEKQAPRNGGRKTPALKPSKQLRILDPSLEQSVPINNTGPEDLGPDEAEREGEKVGEVGNGWGVEVQVSLYGRVGAGHTVSTQRCWPGDKTRLRAPTCYTACEEDILGWVLPGADFCVWGAQGNVYL